MSRFYTHYTPRLSAYAMAAKAIREEYIRNNKEPLTRAQVERKMLVTPGFMFAQGVTLDDVFRTLKTWRLLEILVDNQGNEQFIPVTKDWKVPIPS